MRGIERTVRLRIMLIRQGSAHQRAIVVIAGNCGKGNFERRKQPDEMIVFLLQRRIYQIAGNHDEVGTRRKPVEFLDAARQRGGGIDMPISEQARRLDVQVGNLCDQQRPRAHDAAPGSKRIAPGSTAKPTRSPAAMAIEFGTSTMIALPAAPLIDARWRSPTKLMLST